MARVSAFELYAVDLPFRKPFRHAAGERSSSESLFLKCVTDSGEVGFGESLPRRYVTGETRNEAFELLGRRVLRGITEMEFTSFENVKSFLIECDGKAPGTWIEPEYPQTAAWCAVDLALLDAFGKAFNGAELPGGTKMFPRTLKYSPVISADSRFRFLKSLMKVRLYGCRHVKLKVDAVGCHFTGRWARRILGTRCDIRSDANMAWDVDQALRCMRGMSEHGVRLFEQPVEKDDVRGLARLVRESGLGVMVDESMTDRASLERLIAEKACTAVNVRISKCGGLMASLARCREVTGAGLTLQIGCQVGESSLLSAAQMALISAVEKVDYAEGCFGLHLLREDPAHPVLQFGRGGNPPNRPHGSGFGVEVDETVLERWTVRHETITRNS